MTTPKRLFNALGFRLHAFLREKLGRRFVISLTTEGIFLAGAMLLIGLAALRTNVPLLYLMLSMMGAFFILSAMLATTTLRGLRVGRRVPKIWCAGTPLEVALQVRNQKRRFVSYSLRLEDYLANQKAPVGGSFAPSLRPQQETVGTSYHCVFPKRGRYRFAAISVATRFPFGLIERRMIVSASSDVLIVPQVVELPFKGLLAQQDRGEAIGSVKGVGTSLYGLRDYTSDLSARDIHWKVSARKGSLIAREFEIEQRKRAVVILRNHISQADAVLPDLEFELLIVLASSLLDRLDREGFETELHTSSGNIPYGAGRDHLIRCGRALALLEQVALEADEVPPPPDPNLRRYQLIATDLSSALLPGVIPVSLRPYRALLLEGFRKNGLVPSRAVEVARDSKITPIFKEATP